ncbi:MAG: LPS export ABC transporter permease LptG [Caldilineaceae bacterium]|nr:LPS export ABC transporter permease LptG [Caldilineaceae bacterium]
MKLLDRYIGKSVLASTLVVMIILLALFAFATFAGELDKVGRGTYDASTAIQYTLLLLPRLAYQLFPIVVLLGAIIGLGMMASQNELVVIRAAGVSLPRIIWTVMKIGLLLLVLMLLVGEFAAPAAEFKAQNLRAEAISGQVSFRTDQGLWARDGRSVIHIRDLINAGQVGRVSVYDFDNRNQLHTVTTARTADYDGDGWVLHNVLRSEISLNGVKTTQQPTLSWHSLLNPELIGVVTVKPDYLSAPGLLRYIRYLYDNGLDASQHVLALWKKAVMPLTTLVMIFLAVPFVFGPLRSVGVGQRIFVGTLFGIGYYLLDQTTGHLGLVYGLSPLMSVLVTPVLFLAVAFYMFKRVK